VRWVALVILVLCLGLIAAPHSSIEDPVIPATPSIEDSIPQILDQQAQVPRQQVPIGAFFYVWYGYNTKLQRWTGGNQTTQWNDKPESTFLNQPSKYYSSLDNETIAWQFESMRTYNISFVIVSWWGSNSERNQATINLFKYIVGHHDSIKVALMIEPYAEIDYRQSYNYVYDTYYSKYPDVVFRWLGKPLLCAFLSYPVPFDDRFTLRTVANSENADWNYVAGRAENLISTNKSVNETKLYTNNSLIAVDGEITISPSFDNYYEYLMGGRSDYIILGPPCGMFKLEIEYAKEHASIIVIATWNEYTEQSGLEFLRCEL
jgi:hypothetical protein